MSFNWADDVADEKEQIVQVLIPSWTDRFPAEEVEKAAIVQTRYANMDGIMYTILTRSAEVKARGATMRETDTVVDEKTRLREKAITSDYMYLPVKDRNRGKRDPVYFVVYKLPPLVESKKKKKRSGRNQDNRFSELEKSA